MQPCLPVASSNRTCDPPPPAGALRSNGRQDLCPEHGAHYRRQAQAHTSAFTPLTHAALLLLYIPSLTISQRHKSIINHPQHTHNHDAISLTPPAPGSQLLVVGRRDDREDVGEEIAGEVAAIVRKYLNKDSIGVYADVPASIPLSRL